MADDDDEGMGAMYEEGHWIWDDSTDKLTFVSDRPPPDEEQIHIPIKAPTGAMEFRDDIDLIEQMRYRRRYQRKLKPGQADVITVQDAKDIAIYTAPLSIMSPVLINMLHLPTTERFIKALILCMQYYLQASDDMAQRMVDLESKLRTPLCDAVEAEFAANLNDLRVLVAKEYCTMLIGGADMKKYHHMGAAKKRRSLSNKDARQFETLLRMCVQIVWLALGRKAFNQLELEINRLFKSEIFNAVEHMLKTNYVSKMSKEEKKVLLGPCVRSRKKLNTGSPLMDEVTCHRDIDYRMVGIGVIKMQQTTPRLRYMHAVLAMSEEKLSELGITLGIVGMKRASFDTMLKPLLAASSTKKSAFSMGSMVSKQSTNVIGRSLYPDMYLPPKREIDEYFPAAFPSEPEAPRPCSETQRRRWLNRLHRLMAPARKQC